jgi:hypothetical protein
MLMNAPLLICPWTSPATLFSLMPESEFESPQLLKLAGWDSVKSLAMGEASLFGIQFQMKNEEMKIGAFF